MNTSTTITYWGIGTTTSNKDIQNNVSQFSKNQSLGKDYRDNYEKDLEKRQQDHLDRVYRRNDIHWKPCLHDGCSQCHGTGIKLDGSMCVHMLSCPCPKCTPYC